MDAELAVLHPGRSGERWYQRHALRRWRRQRKLSGSTTRDRSMPLGLQEKKEYIDVVYLPYTMSLELRRLAPGTTTATKPIRDEAIWKRASSGEVKAVAGASIGDE